MYQAQKKIYARAVSGLVRGLALGPRLGHAARLLRPALAGLEQPPGGAVRPGRAALLHLRPGALPAGLHLPGGPAHRGGLSLFLFTAVAGRLWCGYACPQTVYTEIFMWVERKLEGDRAQRMRLDAAPWGANKLLRKGGKQLVWIAHRAVDRLHLRRLLHAHPEPGGWRPPRWASAPGTGSGSASTALPPTATPAGCASRCASTCAPTRASRAR